MLFRKWRQHAATSSCLPLKGSSSRTTLATRPAWEERLHGVGGVFQGMEDVEHAGDLPPPEEFVAGVPYPFGPVGDDDEFPGIVQAAAKRLPVKARGETGRLLASGRRRRAVDEAAGRLAAPVLQRRAGLRIPALCGVHDGQPGFPALRAPVLMLAENALRLFLPHRDPGPVDGQVHARFQRPALDGLLPIEPESLLGIGIGLPPATYQDIVEGRA